MATVRWVVDYKDYNKQRLDRPSAESVRRYFDGFKFNMINRRPMYQDELNDLEMVYKKTLVDLHEQVEQCLPSLLHYMEQFLTLHKQNEAIREKLDVLLAKTGRQTSEESEDDCGGCNE
jgi:hypothetical protein